MKTYQYLGILASVLVAPHLSFNVAIPIAFVCIALAVYLLKKD